MKTMTTMICDKFGAKLKHGNKGNMLVFDLAYLLKIGKAFDRSEGIQSNLEDQMNKESERVAQENSNQSKSDSYDSSDSILGMRSTNDQIESSNKYKNNHCCIQKLDDFKQKLDANKENSDQTYFQVESPESPESLVTKALHFPFFVTSTGTKMYRCPFHVEGCRIQNIHPEEIEYHIKYKHSQNGSRKEDFSYGHNRMYDQTILLNLVIPRYNQKGM
jgi:hypothetical protein